MSFLRNVACAASVAALGVTLTPLTAHAAETITSSGWICTTDALPAVPPNGAGLAKVRAIRPSVTFDASSRMTMRFAAPVPAGATLERTGGGTADRTTESTCTAIGFVDDQTAEGRRYRYEVDASQRAKSVLTVGNKLGPATDRGRVVLVIDQTHASTLTPWLTTNYVPTLEAAGWRVTTEVVSPTATPQSVRTRLRMRVEEDATTTAALLIGEIPVAMSGNDSGAGARPTDVFYADVNGTWTDSSVNNPTNPDTQRRNVPGDGKFDQERAPSALELAVGRVDMSNLDGITRDGGSLGSESNMIGAYLNGSADSRIFDSGDWRDESFIIDDGDPMSDAGTRGWQSGSALGGPVRHGTRAELDELRDTLGSRPTLLFQHGSATPSTLTTWGGSTLGDIADLATVGGSRFVVSAGAETRQWNRPNALSRAMLTNYGAKAATSDHLDADGLALGDPIGASFAAGIADSERGGDPLGSLMGDPTLTLRPTGVQDAAPNARMAEGCADTSVRWTLAGGTSSSEVTADIYRSINDGAFERVGSSTATWDEEQWSHRGAFTDAAVATNHRNATVRYEVRPRILHITGRGSFYTNAPSRTSAPLLLPARCNWLCNVETAPLPTDSVERSRSAQLESTVRFLGGGQVATITLDRRHTGRTLTGRRIDQPSEAASDPCESPRAALGYRAFGLIPAKISEFELQEEPNGPRIPVLAGYNLPARYDRGRVVLVVDRTLNDVAGARSALYDYEEALEADGFVTTRLTVERSDSVASVRSRLKALYDAVPQQTKAAVLIGHVPVPYSGTGAYDGHGEHNGAWSTDAPYADLDGTWTDTSVNMSNPARPQNRNVPGDGKFDQDDLPSRAELSVGRIDFADMPVLGKTEADLVADYLRRSIAYRQGVLAHRSEAFTRSNFGPSAGILSNVSPVVGSGNVRVNRSAADVRADARVGGPYLIASASGPGSYSTSSGIGTTTDPVPALFMGSLGSYYGDWDSRDNFLRGHLAKNLGAMWENWSVDGMVLGESIGETVQRHMNNPRRTVRSRLNSFLGDPTLRAYPLKGVTDLIASEEAGCQYSSLTWTPSSDPTVTGYVIERKYGDQWRLITSTPLARTIDRFNDGLQRGFYSGVYYRVRPIRQQVTSRGSFTNLGQGALAYAGSCD